MYHYFVSTVHLNVYEVSELLGNLKAFQIPFYYSKKFDTLLLKGRLNINGFDLNLIELIPEAKEAFGQVEDTSRFIKLSGLNKANVNSMLNLFNRHQCLYAFDEKYGVFYLVFDNTQQAIDYINDQGIDDFVQTPSSRELIRVTLDLINMNEYSLKESLCEYEIETTEKTSKTSLQPSMVQ
jgi:hypothetical protein